MTETLPMVLARMAGSRGDATALVFGERATSFGALDRDSASAAAALVRAAALPGDRIGYLGKNSDRFFELLFAAAKARVVMVPIGWRLTLPEVAFLVQDAGITFLFVEPAFHALANELARGGAFIVVSTEQDIDAAPGYVRWRAEGADTDLPPGLADAGEAVLQLYTSGTTGHPKGALLSHANLFALRPLSVAAGLDWDRWQDGDVSLVTMPVAHVSGSLWGLIGIYNGMQSLILPEFDAGKVLDAISREPISKVFLVPAAIQALLRHPRVATADFSRLRHILYGASPIPLELLREAMATFGCGFVQNYGMTETCGTIAALAPEDHDPAGSDRMRAAGRAMPGVEIKIVDGDLTAVANGTIGEVVVRSPTTMLGYWNRDEATRQTLVDGWIRTGDAGFLDDAGYLFIQDRLKDMIISGGENVYPAEVEGVLYGHPAIADVAVIGIPDPR